MVDPALVVMTSAQLRDLVVEAVREAVGGRPVTGPVSTGREPLTKSELSQRLKVSPATIDRWCRQGLPHFYAGTHRRFELPKVREWLSARGKAPAERGPGKPPPASLEGVRRLKRGG